MYNIYTFTFLQASMHMSLKQEAVTLLLYGKASEYNKIYRV